MSVLSVEVVRSSNGPLSVGSDPPVVLLVILFGMS